MAQSQIWFVPKRCRVISPARQGVLGESLQKDSKDRRKRNKVGEDDPEDGVCPVPMRRTE